MVCSKCSQIYHPKCVGINKRIFRKFCQQALDSWECFACKNDEQRRMTEGYVKEMEELMKCSAKEIEERTQRCKDMAIQLQYVDRRIEHLKKKYYMFLNMGTELSGAFEYRSEGLNELQNEVQMVKDILENMKKPPTKAPKNTICIGNISEDPSVDDLEIVRRTAKALNVEFDEAKVASGDIKVTSSYSLRFSGPVQYEELVEKFGHAFTVVPSESVQVIDYDLLKK